MIISIFRMKRGVTRVSTSLLSDVHRQVPGYG